MVWYYLFTCNNFVNIMVECKFHIFNKVLMKIIRIQNRIKARVFSYTQLCILQLFILRFAIFSDDKKNKWKLNLHTILMTKYLLFQWIVMLSCRIWWSQNHIKYCVQSPWNFTDKCWRRGDNNWAFGEYWCVSNTTISKQFASSVHQAV